MQLVQCIHVDYLVATSHTGPANKLSLCQLVVGVVVLILSVLSVVRAKPMEMPCSWPFHIRSCIANELRLTHQIHRWMLLPTPSGGSYAPGYKYNIYNINQHTDYNNAGTR